jgi:hypothetical protein
MRMALYWVVREVDGERQIYVQEASTEMYAALGSAIDGFEGDLKEVIPLDAKTANSRSEAGDAVTVGPYVLGSRI